MVVGVEVLRGGVGHARRHGGCLGQDTGTVDGLRKMGGVRGGRGGWHVEFVVSGAHRHLLDASVLAVTVQRLAAHDQLPFSRHPRCDGDRLRSGQPQRLQIHTVYRDERYVAGQPYCAGVRRPPRQRDALDRLYVPRLRQKVCGRRRGTADSNAALAAILEEVDLPCAIIQSMCESCEGPICILDLGDDLEERTIVVIKIFAVTEHTQYLTCCFRLFFT